VAITSLIGTECAADEWDVNAIRSGSYRSWLRGELVLVGALGLATALLAAVDRLGGYEAPAARLALDMAVVIVAAMVAVLASIRFLVGGWVLDVLLAAGFAVSALGMFAFGVAPKLDGTSLSNREAWATIAAQVAGAALIAGAPFVGVRVTGRERALVAAGVASACVLVLIWVPLELAGVDRPLVGSEGERSAAAVLAAYATLAMLALVATIGFGLRYRKYSRDLDRWLALALTLVVFADLQYVLAPVLSTEYVLQGDFLRLLSYAVLLVGVWRAISRAEFGHAVAEERARVARDIHDGLAQYLFAISTHVNMLECGAPLDDLLPRLKAATTAAQQEARFAVLALSSASGTASFDTALRRYVDVLTADGRLDVELEVDPSVSLAPDEQIEVFRIVQEGLANARRHADSRRAWVTIGARGPRRVVTVEDDGVGFDDAATSEGQGLRNIRQRAESMSGELTLRSTPGEGTSIEVVLRAA
jgi:signal transduction histidine kinase